MYIYIIYMCVWVCVVRCVYLSGVGGLKVESHERGSVDLKQGPQRLDGVSHDVSAFQSSANTWH